MEFGITVFAPYVVVNYVSSDVQEGAACETLVLLTFHQQCIRVVQSLGTFKLTFLHELFRSSIRDTYCQRSDPINNSVASYL